MLHMRLPFHIRTVIAITAILLTTVVTVLGASTGKGDALGMDVSHHNGKITWKKVVGEGVDFVYIKATEGATYTDTCFSKFWKGAKDAGLKVGAYHYFRMTSSVSDQFSNFRKALSGLESDLRPMVDVETADGKPVAAVRDSLRRFLSLIEKEYNVTPMIYATNRSFNEICGNEFERYPKYIGRYGSDVPVIKGRSHYTVWQYSEKGRISGVEKEVDLCKFHPDCGMDDIIWKERSLVEIVRKGDLVVYYPNFTRIDLATGTMPSKTDRSVIFCCEAAFTGEKLTEFRHSNIAGHHVCSGKFYEGFHCGPNNGVFTWSRSDGWHFYNNGHKNSVTPLKAVAANGGMGFCQSMLFCNGTQFKGCFKPEKENQYRALCEIDGRLCIVDCARSLPFGEFLAGLKKLGVRNAVYCDMGDGWNYSWYRNDKGEAVEIFHNPGRYTTNWITFYSD